MFLELCFSSSSEAGVTFDLRTIIKWGQGHFLLCTPDTNPAPATLLLFRRGSAVIVVDIPNEKSLGGSSYWELWVELDGLDAAGRYLRWSHWQRQTDPRESGPENSCCEEHFKKQPIGYFSETGQLS